MYHSQSNSSSFSMANFDDDHDELYSYSADSVDCTLSLGTPSTRLSDADNHNHQKKRTSGFGWKLFPSSSSKNNTAPPPSKSHRGSNSASASSDDSLWARRCANCDTTSTPLWRNGPRGPKSLCNACGIRYKKEERRAMAAAAASTAANSQALVAPQYTRNAASQWPETTMPCYPSPYGNECYPSSYRNEYQDDVMYHDDTDAATAFHSWPAAYGEAEFAPSFYL